MNVTTRPRTKAEFEILLDGIIVPDREWAQIAHKLSQLGNDFLDEMTSRAQTKYIARHTEQMMSAN